MQGQYVGCSDAYGTRALFWHAAVHLSHDALFVGIAFHATASLLQAAFLLGYYRMRDVPVFFEILQQMASDGQMCAQCARETETSRTSSLLLMIESVEIGGAR